MNSKQINDNKIEILFPAQTAIDNHKKCHDDEWNESNHGYCDEK